MMMRIRFWCNHCGEFDKIGFTELDEIGAYTIPARFCPKCMYILRHEVVDEVVETTKDEDKDIGATARPAVTKQNEQTANDNKADVKGTVS